ncbi:Catechol 2,3-dioxygenase [Goodfellowiella coeruleoviolacea]|uniref:Catechol 2,3-dioxygenase n=1 Tax=Goodfellowiella coeruleoviolacea TaxID=334858 RepID=A0AAE3GD04_9PSEU|nr:Catechol 2,3-dioxygenase [Goodfellowiella coeruleoviolacea]
MELLSSRFLLHPTDPDRTVAFYRDTLGLAVHREFPGGTVFFLGQGLLEVSGRGSTGPSPDLGLWLQVRDLAAAFQELSARNVPVLREPRREPWGLDEMWIADPDGTRIVLVEIPAGHPLRTDVRWQAGTPGDAAGQAPGGADGAAPGRAADAAGVGADAEPAG